MPGIKKEFPWIVFVVQERKQKETSEHQLSVNSRMHMCVCVLVEP